jgi:hypothetical protein
MPIEAMLLSAVTSALLHTQSAAHAANAAVQCVWKQAHWDPPSTVAGLADTLTHGPAASAAASSPGVPVDVSVAASVTVEAGLELLEHATAVAPAPKSDTLNKNFQMRMGSPPIF